LSGGMHFVNKRSRVGVGAITVVCLTLGFGASAQAQIHSTDSDPVQKGGGYDDTRNWNV